MLRYIWAGPNTCIGLIAAAVSLVAGGRIRLHRGVLEADGRLLAWGLANLTALEGGAAAITFGHVVLARDAATLDQTRAHERVHVRQYEQWGPLFIPAYLFASLWARLAGRHPYFDNPFERDADDERFHSLDSPHGTPDLQH